MSQNSGNSLVRWLSERRAKDAERETYIENGVISQDDVARWCCRGGWLANLGLSDELAREMASQCVRLKARVRVRLACMASHLIFVSAQAATLTAT